MNVRSKIIKIRNLPQGDRRIACINSKPFALLFALLIGGILLICTHNDLLGIIAVVFSLYYLCFTKNEKLAEFYENYAVFYHINDQKDACYLLYWCDIQTWQCHAHLNDYDEIEIAFHNEQRISLRCIGKHKIKRYFKRFVSVEKVLLHSESL